MNQLIALLMLFISQNSDLNVNVPLPGIILLHPDYISEYYNTLNDSQGIENIEAFYDNKKRVIVLNSDFKVKRVIDQAILVHELVHHYQIVNNVPKQCMAELEKLAYELGNKWAIDHGEKEQMDIFTIMVRSSCTE